MVATGLRRRSRHPLQERFVALLKHAPVMVWMADDRGDCTFFNNEWLKFTGRTLEEQIGGGWLADVHEDDRAACLSQYVDGFKSRRPFVLQYRLRRADGCYRWIHDSALPLYREDGRFTGYVGSCFDITEQRDDAAALRYSTRHLNVTTALLSAVIDQMHDGMLAETSERTVLLANHAFCRLFNIPERPLDLLGRPTESISEDVAAVLGGDHSPLRKLDGAAERQVCEHRLPSGVDAEWYYMPVQLGGGDTIHVWQFHDVTDRRRSEEELQTSRQRLRELTAHLETVREDERGALARALHDDVGQTLTSVRLELSAAIDEIRNAAGAPTLSAIDRLQAAVGLVDLSLDAVRRVSTALRPPILDQFGVVAAVKWEAALFEKRTGIRCRVHPVPPRIQLPPSHATVLYRILLEALTNVVRHAHAGAVDIRLRKRKGVALMEVRDNGRGIKDHETGNPRTMGLLGMRERALTVGGDVRITGARGGGTSVLVILPLAPNEAGSSQ